MNKFTLAALAAAALIVCLPGSAWSDETAAKGSTAPAEPAPAPASAVAPGWYPPAYPGGYVQSWQQAPRWPAPQQAYGQFPPRYQPGGQYPAFPAKQATAPTPRENPLSAELKQTQEQLTAKSGELDEARTMLEQLRNELQESRETESTLSDKITYSTREQQALRLRVTELMETLKTANATLEQQHQLISNHQAQNQALTAERDQLHSALASRDEQLATLQSELQAATQALAQERTRASTAAEALSAARVQIGMQRDELTRLEAELEHLENSLQGETQEQTE